MSVAMLTETATSPQVARGLEPESRWRITWGVIGDPVPLQSVEGPLAPFPWLTLLSDQWLIATRIPASSAATLRKPEHEFPVGDFRGVAFRRDDRAMDIQIVHVPTKRVVWRGVTPAYAVWTWAAHIEDYIPQLEAEMAIAAGHTQDSDCTVDPATNCCVACGVEHGDPCEFCSGRGFHAERCVEIATCDTCGCPIRNRCHDVRNHMSGPSARCIVTGKQCA